MDFHPIERWDLRTVIFVSILLIHDCRSSLLLCGDMSGAATVSRVSLDSSAHDEAHPIAAFSDHTKYVVRAKWSPNGQAFATASYDKSVCLYT